MERCAFIQFPAEVQRTVSQSVARLVSGGRSRNVAMQEGSTDSERSEANPDGVSATED